MVSVDSASAAVDDGGDVSYLRYYMRSGRGLSLMAPRFPMALRVGLLAVSLAALALGVAGQALAQQRHALVGEVDGMINPVTQRYISRVIEKGEEDGAEIVIIKLDTPGGLLSSTEKIVEDLLGATVPTAVFVYPAGAAAASAGTFITAAANFAVMSPGSNIGAATPVASGGEDIPETLKTKVVEHTASRMRAIAEQRNRNAQALEDTVRKALSYDATQAVELGVADFITADILGLLAEVDGSSVKTAAGTVVLDTSGLVLNEEGMNLIEKFLFFLADPNVSFLLLSIGGLGIVVELFNPGLIFPALVGVICLVLAFLSLGNLPVNWAGAALILFAMALLVAELLVSGFGVLGVGAIVSFILGALILFSGTGLPNDPSPRVSLWLLVPFASVIFAGGGYVMWTITQSRKRPADVGAPTMVGEVGEVTSELAPRGIVRMRNEHWTAVTEGPGSVPAGVRVRVVEVDGVILTVSKLDDQPEPEEGPT